MSKKTQVEVQVVSGDQGHLIGHKFSAEKREQGGYINYTVNSADNPIQFKEEDVVEI